MRARRLVLHLRRRGLPHLQALGLDRDGRLRDGRPERAPSTSATTPRSARASRSGAASSAIAQLRYGIPDIRPFWEDDLRFLSSSDESPAQLAARVRRGRTPPRRSSRRAWPRPARSSGSIRRGVADEDGNLGLFRVGRVLEAGEAPERRPAAALSRRRGGGRAAPDRLRRLELRRRRQGRRRAAGRDAAERPDARAAQAARRGLRGDDPRRGRARPRQPTTAGSCVLDDGPEPGTPLADVLPLVDDVLDLELDPEPARPALGLRRRARGRRALRRRAGAAAGIRSQTAVTGRRAEVVQVEVEDLEGCPRYIGRLFQDVTIGPSPAWLKARLVAAGMRPISNVVDVTNYVMLALGNPLHAFDLDQLARAASSSAGPREGEKIRTLDGEERTLEPDRPGDRRRVERRSRSPGSWAARRREVDESDDERPARGRELRAGRDPPQLRAPRPAHGRLEPLGEGRRPAPRRARRRPRDAADRRARRRDARPARPTCAAELPERPVVRCRPERANELIGLELADKEQQRILDRPRLRASRRTGTSRVPTWRARDVTREVDVVEEVARFQLDEIPFTLPAATHAVRTLTREQRLRRRVEDALVGAGCSETYTHEPVGPTSTRTRCACRAAHLRPGRAPHDAARRPRRHRGAATPTWATRASRCSSSPASTCRRPTRARGALARRAGSSDGGFADGEGGRRDALRGAEGRADLRAHAAAVPPSRQGGRVRRAAGSASSTRRGSRASGARSSSTWRRCSPRVPERLVYEDVITFPAVRQDLAFRRRRTSPPRSSPQQRERRPARSCARCARSTSTAASRSARAASRSPSRSPSSRPSGR